MKQKPPYTRLLQPSPEWQDSRYVNRRKPQFKRWAMRFLTAALTAASIAQIATVWEGGSPEAVFSCVLLVVGAFASSLLTP